MIGLILFPRSRYLSSIIIFFILFSLSNIITSEYEIKITLTASVFHFSNFVISSSFYFLFVKRDSISMNFLAICSVA